jgi:uncharacterized protein (UPF0212 family)
MTIDTLTKVACPHCNEPLDPAYLTNTVIIEGDPAKVCDSCLDSFEECHICHQYHHTGENNKAYVSHDHGYQITCDDCGSAAHDAYEAAMELKFEEARLEGRRYL